jgi:phosphohistidine phosphatase
MRLYLVQHGNAKSKEENPDRPLTERGVSEVTQVTERLKSIGGLEVDRIVHSGKTRARQTAELFAEAFVGAPTPQMAADLNPNDDPGIWAGRLAGTAEGGVMLVGHLPYMERMAGLLIAGDPGVQAVRFQQGAVLCLERVEDGSWVVRWFLTPELAG